MKISTVLNKEKIANFYDGYLYPAVISLLVLIGSVTGTEVFTFFLNWAFIIGALFFTDSLKPIIINLCTFIYQISVENSPFFPSYSDYYSSSWRLPVLIILAVILFGAIAYFIVKNELYKGISLKNTPLLLPLLIFSASLAVNGIFSGVWVYKNLVYALSQAVVYLFVFLLLYQGLKKENAGSLVKYFAYISMLMALIISAEVAHLYLSSDTIFVDGSINKVGVALGWGIWNLIGVSAFVLIPMNFYGMAKNKYPWLYFSVATLIWIVAVLSMSRNALIFGTLTYAACVLIFSFVGEKKKIFRIIVAVGIAFAALFAVVFFDKIYSLFKDFFDRGLSDNGRFNIWRAAFDNFLNSPIFRRGF